MTVRIPDDKGNRDSGKVFVITEMFARPLEKWAYRALQAVAAGGAQIPEGRGGMAELAQLGFQALANAPFEMVEPLMDEMMGHVVIQPDPNNPEVTRPLIDKGGASDDIEEVTTRFKLRAEWFTLHTGFSLADGLSTSGSPRAAPPAAA